MFAYVTLAKIFFIYYNVQNLINAKKIPRALQIATPILLDLRCDVSLPGAMHMHNHLCIIMIYML
jgi:hypothetical protein